MTGRCPFCHAEVETYADGTLRDHFPRSGQLLEPRHPLGCRGARHAPETDR